MTRSHRPSRAGRVIQVLWIGGFTIGTVSHIVDLINGGADVYSGFAFPLRAFWVSLTLWDPLVIALLLWGRRAGVFLGIAVILVDISVNWSVIAQGGDIPVWGAVNQTLFAVLVLASSRVLHRWMSAPETSTR